MLARIAERERERQTDRQSENTGGICTELSTISFFFFFLSRFWKVLSNMPVSFRTNSHPPPRKDDIARGTEKQEKVG
jgi:hypothetical protein